MLFYEKFLLAKHDRVILRERLSHWNEYFIYCSRKLSSIQPFTWIPINDHQLLTTQNHIHSFRLFRSISICMRVCVSVSLYVCSFGKCLQIDWDLLVDALITIAIRFLYLIFLTALIVHFYSLLFSFRNFFFFGLQFIFVYSLISTRLISFRLYGNCRANERTNRSELITSHR